MASSTPIIVIGASAGGVEALSTLVRLLPRDLGAAVFVAVHFPAGATSAMPRILGRAGVLPASHATDGEPIQPGRIYVSPPDRHLIVLRTSVRLASGPRENGNRPALDPMFRSAAVSHGPAVVGVVLTGNLDDGTAGLLAIKRHGGVAIVQDPSEALFPSMPASAIDHVAVDHVLSVRDIPSRLSELARSIASRGLPVPGQA